MTTPPEWYRGAEYGKGKRGRPPKKKKRLEPTAEEDEPQARASHEGPERVPPASSFDAENMEQPRIPLPAPWLSIWREREARIKELETELEKTKRALERAGDSIAD